jgi:hypothetical protein
MRPVHEGGLAQRIVIARHGTGAAAPPERLHATKVSGALAS